MSEEHIHQYYTPMGLYDRILNGLAKLGRELSEVTLDDLAPVDEFHIRGDEATRELIALSGFAPDMHILEVGCGIGGAARRLAHEAGCRVTGLDLSVEYIETAKRLTQLLNMPEEITFVAASALALPFGNDTFDGAWSIQMNMNIEDKPAWLKELFRVLKPGSRLVLYEVCGHTITPLHFPVPWAQSDSMSFLVPPDAFREIIESAGFALEVWHDKTDLAKIEFAQAKKPEGTPELPILGSYLLVGDDIKTKAYNLRRNLEEERVSLIEAIALKC